MSRKHGRQGMSGAAAPGVPLRAQAHLGACSRQVPQAHFTPRLPPRSWGTARRSRRPDVVVPFEVTHPATAGAPETTGGRCSIYPTVLFRPSPRARDLAAGAGSRLFGLGRSAGRGSECGRMSRSLAVIGHLPVNEAVPATRVASRRPGRSTRHLDPKRIPAVLRQCARRGPALSYAFRRPRLATRRARERPARTRFSPGAPGWPAGACGFRGAGASPPVSCEAWLVAAMPRQLRGGAGARSSLWAGSGQRARPVPALQTPPGSPLPQAVAESAVRRVDEDEGGDRPWNGASNGNGVARVNGANGANGHGAAHAGEEELTVRVEEPGTNGAEPVRGAGAEAGASSSGAAVEAEVVAGPRETGAGDAESGDEQQSEEESLSSAAGTPYAAPARWSKIKGYSTLQRSWEIWSFAVKFFFRYWLLGRRFTYGREGMTPQRVSARKRELAKWLVEGLVRLGPTFIKIGQQFSTRVDVLSKEFIEELEQLQDRVPAFDSGAAMRILETSLGRPVSEVFEHIEAEPIAAASLGQVHLARLRDGSPPGEGRKVVVKIQRPGLKELFDIDLKNVRVLAQWLQKLDPKTDGTAR